MISRCDVGPLHLLLNDHAPVGSAEPAQRLRFEPSASEPLSEHSPTHQPLAARADYLDLLVAQRLDLFGIAIQG